MFKQLPEWRRPGEARRVTLSFEGSPIEAFEGDSVAAAVLASGPGHTRHTPVHASPRAPYCMMGVCFDCQMEIDGVPNQQSCLVPVREGMSVRRQRPGTEVAGEARKEHAGD